MITFQWVSRPPSPHRTLPKTNLQTTDGESARNTANFSRTAKKKREVYSKERQKSKRECDASGSGWMRRWQQQQQQQLRFSSNCLKWSLGRSKRVSEWVIDFTLSNQTLPLPARWLSIMTAADAVAVQPNDGPFTSSHSFLGSWQRANRVQLGP